MKTFIIALALACFALPFVASAELKAADHVGDIKDPVEMRTDFVRDGLHSVLLMPAFEVQLPVGAQRASFVDSQPGI
jgi:hypothetical protein